MSIARTTPAQNPRGAQRTTRKEGLVGVALMRSTLASGAAASLRGQGRGVKGVRQAAAMKFQIKLTRACPAGLGASRIMDPDDATSSHP